jgi:hypothetical protein
MGEFWWERLTRLCLSAGKNAENVMTHTGRPLKHLLGAFLIPDGTPGIATHRTLGGRDRVKEVFPTPRPNAPPHTRPSPPEKT